MFSLERISWLSISLYLLCQRMIVLIGLVERLHNIGCDMLFACLLHVVDEHSHRDLLLDVLRFLCYFERGFALQLI